MLKHIFAQNLVLEPQTEIVINDLIAQAQSGSKNAFAEIYNRYAAAVSGIIFRFTQSRESSEDLLQDSFVRIWKNIGSYDPAKGSFFTWIVRIARNTVIDHMRSKEFKSQQIQKHFLFEIYEEKALTDNEDRIQLNSLVAKLEPQCRQIIDLVYIWGFSQDEVSRMLNIPLGTVKSRSRNAVRQLRKMIQS